MNQSLLSAPLIKTSATAAEKFSLQINDYVRDYFSEQLGAFAEQPKIDIAAEVADWVNFARHSKVISGIGVSSFNPYQYQVELCRVFLQCPGVCAAKIRQCGITETFGSIFLWKASKNPAYTAVVFSQGGEATAKIAERVKRMALSNPYCQIEKANTKEVSLVGGGRILFRTSNAGASRGLSSVHDVLFDEWAFVSPKGLDRTLWADITPAQEIVGKAARIAVVSTPPDRPGTQYMDILKSNNGKKDLFKVSGDMRDGLINPIQWWIDDNGWAKFFIHWKAHPIFAKRTNHLEQIRTSKKLDEVRLQREHNLNFEVKDSATLVDITKIPRYNYPDAIPANPWLIVQSWDTAQSDRPGSAKWAGITCALYDGNIYLIDVLMRKMKFTEGLTALKQFARDNKPHLILIENKSSGADLIDSLENDGFPFPVKAVEPSRGNGAGDDPKVRRFSREVHQIEAGKLILPNYAPWLTDVETSLKGFPEKDHRDFADSLSQLLYYVRSQAEDDLDEPEESGQMLGTLMSSHNDFG